MSDELKPQASIDSPEFRTLARDYAWAWKEGMTPEEDLEALKKAKGDKRADIQETIDSKRAKIDALEKIMRGK